MVKASTQCVEGFSVGLNKGYVTTDVKKMRPKASNMKRTSKRTKNIRNVVRKICGLTPFEKKVFEMYKTGVQIVEDRAFRLIKKRLGTMRRAKNKSQKMLNMVKTVKK